MISNNQMARTHFNVNDKLECIIKNPYLMVTFAWMQCSWIAVGFIGCILSIVANANCSSSVSKMSVIGHQSHIIEVPFVSLHTLKTVDEIFLPNSPLKKEGLTVLPPSSTRDWIKHYFFQASVIEVANPNLVQESRNLIDLKTKLYRFINLSNLSSGLHAIIWAVSEHWKRAGVSHKILNPLDPQAILILPQREGSPINDFAYHLKKEINLDLVLEHLMYRQGNAAIRKKVWVRDDGHFGIRGKFFLPLESVFEPQSISPALIHEIIHAIGLEMFKKHQSYVFLGKIERLRSSATSSSKVSPPPSGVGRGQNLEYRLPYGFNYAFDEMEAHHAQALAFLRQNLLPNKELLYSGMIMSAQIKYLARLAVNHGPGVVKRDIRWINEFGLTGTLAFDFGPPLGLLMFYLPIPELNISRSEYILLRKYGRSPFLDQLEIKVKKLEAAAATREASFWYLLRLEDRKDLRYFYEMNGKYETYGN